MDAKFIPPSEGHVIGIHNAKPIVYIMSRMRVFLFLLLIIILLIDIGINGEVSRENIFPLLMIAAFLVPLLIRMRVNHHGKQVQIILRKSGVSLAESKIELAFASRSAEPIYGIARFRLKSDSMMIDTTEVKGNRVYLNSSHISEVEFKLPTEYLEHKDEFIAYLNSLAERK